MNSSYSNSLRSTYGEEAAPQTLTEKFDHFVVHYGEHAWLIIPLIGLFIVLAQ